MKKILLPALLFLCFNSLFAGNGDRIKIVFRFDDFVLVPSRLSDSLLNTFSRNRIPLCIGIIPFDTAGKFINRLDSAKISDLRSRIKKGEVEIALHGFNHRNRVKRGWFSKATFSEFAAVPYDVQLKRISAGKAALDSLLQTDVETFVPPFNTYDENTIKVLESLGFKVLSGSMQGSSSGKAIRYIPATHEDFSGLHKIIVSNKNKNVSVIIYFHPYTFKGNSSAYESESSGVMYMKDLDALLAWLNTQNLDFNTFSGLAGKENFNRVMYHDNSMKYNLLKKSLNYLKFYNYATISSSESSESQALLLAGNILLHLLVFSVVFYFACFVLKILHPGIFAVLIILSICIVPITVFLVYIRNNYSFGMIVIMLAVIAGAFLLSILKTYRLQEVINKPINKL